MFSRADLFAECGFVRAYANPGVLGTTKETALERADFTLHLLMFVTAEKERTMFIISFFPVFVSCCPRNFKLGQAECAQTTKAQTNRPRSQLFLM